MTSPADYWRNAFERSLPEERETNIECCRDVIPAILDTEKQPLDVEDVVYHVCESVTERRRLGHANLCRIRLVDEHVLAALDRLVQPGDTSPAAVVKIQGELATYWTRHHAESAGLKIVEPRLTSVKRHDTCRHDDCLGASRTEMQCCHGSGE